MCVSPSDGGKRTAGHVPTGRAGECFILEATLLTDTVRPSSGPLFPCSSVPTIQYHGNIFHTLALGKRVNIRLRTIVLSLNCITQKQFKHEKSKWLHV